MGASMAGNFRARGMELKALTRFGDMAGDEP